MTKLLLVCMGNICRSPMALAVARKLAEDAGLSPPLAFDSAGTHAPRIGERPDPRAAASLARRGYQIGRGRSRRITQLDFERFDLILGMDSHILVDLRRSCAPEYLNKLHLFLDFSQEHHGTDVPDPYFGSVAGFDRVVELCEAGARGLIKRHACAPRH